MSTQKELRPIEDRLESTLSDYYLERFRIHLTDSYLGIGMQKFPEDLRVLEQLLWEDNIETVVEVGLGLGGSALWFRDRLWSVSRYRRGARNPLVISVDRNVAPGRENLQRIDPDYAESIRLVEADVRDPDVVRMVDRYIRDDCRVLVVEDSAHTYETTTATLRHFSHLVPPLGHVVIEDSHRDVPGLVPPEEIPGQGRGVLAAIADWLSSEDGARFVQQREEERYIVTSNPGGWLQRVR